MGRFEPLPHWKVLVNEAEIIWLEMRTKPRRHPADTDVMTTIKATCPGCGEVDLTADDILLRIGAQSEGNTYGFSCPGCTDFVQKPADERVVRLLLSGGVMPTLVHVPAEALEPRTGPPIDHDDLIAFHDLLESDDWFEQLLGQNHS